MKKIALLVAALLFTLASVALAKDVYVHGYTRSNGTYVQPHYRSAPNQYRYDNYSSQGNTNPYTGQKGYERNEFSTPPAYNKSYSGGTYQTPNYNYNRNYRK